jgi:RHS repeat-associated protein
MKARTARPATALIFTCLFGLTAVRLTAQTDALQDVGIYPFTEQLPVEVGFINAVNGDLHLEIPLGAFTQRGSNPFTAVLTYDSAIWSQLSCCYWEPGNVRPGPYRGVAVGWRLIVSADPGVKSNDWRTVATCNLDGAPEWQIYNNFVWSDHSGTTHTWKLQTTQGFVTRCGDFTSRNHPTADGLENNQSGYHIYITNYSDAVIYGPDGTLVYSNPNIISPPYQNPKDANGNYFTLDSNHNVIDTLGRTPVTMTTNGNTVTFAVLNSQGGTSSYVATLGTAKVSTNFGNSQYVEYSGTLGTMQSLALPDGTHYTFGYDSGTTPGHYGDMTSMTLPTGGQIRYVYSTFIDSMFHVPGPHITRVVSSRTTPDGAWTYTPLVTQPCTTQLQTLCLQQLTVQQPSGDNVVVTSGVYPTFASAIQEDYYNGAVAVSNLLSTQTRTFDSDTPLKTAETTTLQVPGGTSVNRTTQYAWDKTNNIGHLLTKSEWKFYTGTLPTVADRTTTFTYLSGSGYQNIINRPATVTVTDKNNATVAQTVNCYDYAGGCGGSSFTSVAGIAHHDDTNYGASNTVRGDLTQVQNLISGTSNYLTTSMTYDTTGQAASATDSKGNQTAFGHVDKFFNDVGDTSNPSAYTPPAPTNAYLTSLTQGALTSAFGYYWGTGQRALVTDPNSQTSYSHFYDPLNRPTSTKLPDGGWTYSVYPPGSEIQSDTYAAITAPSLTTSCPLTSPNCRHSQTLLDGLGRVTSEFLVSDPDGQTTVSTAYDIDGRVQKRSNPYRSISDPTYGWETPGYDGLARVIQSTHPDGSIAKTYYGASVGSGGGATTQLCSSSTYGLGYPVLSVDEAGKKSQFWTDGFGRIVEADEPDSAGTLTVGTCYKYDLNNDLITVVQGARTRNFFYDMLSRLTQGVNPESGTITYSHTDSSGGLCSGNASAVCIQTAFSPNQPSTGTSTVTTTYTYDTLNRLTGKSYQDNYTSNSPTPAVNYGYDGNAPSGCVTAPPSLTDSYPVGRRTSICDGSGATSWSHDKMGRVAAEMRTIVGSTNITKTITYAPYNLDGSLAMLTYPSNRIVTYTSGAAGRPVAATENAHSINYVTGATYAPQGGLFQLTNGGSVSRAMTYNSRLQLLQLYFTAGAISSGTLTQLQQSACPTTPASIMSRSYNFGLGTNDNGNVQTVTDCLNTDRTQNFDYDNLNRLLDAYTTGKTTAKTNWGEVYTIDAAGNLTNIAAKTGWHNSESLNAAPATVQNQLNGFCYDAAGNMTGPTPCAGSTYTYDAENRLSATAGYTYRYDGDGERLIKCAGAYPTCSSGTLYWTGTGYGTLAETDWAGAPTEEYVFFNGTRVARRDGATNAVDYYFADHLGSTDVITGSAGGVQKKSLYYPFGGEIAVSGSAFANNYKFTGKERDAESGLDDFGARYYASATGRFMTADDGSDQDPRDPQSWNLYGYARNNPIRNLDPTGRACVQSEAERELGKWHDDNSPGETCAQVDAANKRALADAARESDDSLNWRARVVFGNPIFGQALKTVNVLGGTLVVGGVVVTGGIALGAISGTGLTTLGTITVSQASNLAPLVLPAGTKVAQMIARTGIGRGDPSKLLQYVNELRQAAIEAGTSVENVNYMGSGNSIYRSGSTFITVARDGVIRSIVTQSQAGWGVVKAYFNAGGR